MITDKVNCPYCDNLSGLDDDEFIDGLNEAECKLCSKKFVFYVYAKPIFSSHKAPCLNDEKGEHYLTKTGIKSSMCKICFKVFD